MLLNGTHTCEKCNTINEWVYIVPQKISEGNFEVDTIPHNKIHLSKRKRISDTEYEMCYRCHKCDYLNVFNYTSEKYL